MSSPDKPPLNEEESQKDKKHTAHATASPNKPPVNEDESKKDKKQKQRSSDGRPELAMANDGVELRNLDGVASINITMKAGPMDAPAMSPSRNKSSASACAAAAYDGGIAITATASRTAISPGSRRRFSSAKSVSNNDVIRAGETIIGPTYAVNISKSYGTIHEEGGGRHAGRSNDSKSALQVVSTETITRQKCIYNVEQEKPKPRPASPTTYVQGVVQSGPGYYSANALCQSVPARLAQQQVSPIQQIGVSYLPVRTSSAVGMGRTPSQSQQQEIAAALSRSNAGQTVSVCCRSNTQLNRSPTNLAQHGVPCQQVIQPPPVYQRQSLGYVGQANAICQQGPTGGHQALLATCIQAPQAQAVVNQNAPMQPQCRTSLNTGFQSQGATTCQTVTTCQAPSQPCVMIPINQEQCRPSLTGGLQSQHVTDFRRVTSTGQLPPQQVCTMNAIGQVPTVTSCQMTVAGCPKQSIQGFQSPAVGQQACTMNATGQAPAVTSCQMTVAGCPKQSMQGVQSPIVGQVCTTNATGQAPAATSCQMVVAGCPKQSIQGFQSPTIGQQVCTTNATGQAPSVTSCQMTVAGCPKQSIQGSQSPALGQPILPVSQLSPLSVQIASCQQRYGYQPIPSQQIPVTRQQAMYQQQQQQYFPDTGTVYQQRTIGYRRSLELTESQDDNRNYMPQPTTTNIVLGIEMKKKSSKHEKSDVDSSAASKSKRNSGSSGKKSQ
ncbi:uncharacterized protein LOC135385455 [Ornithodoros turicata]|uniref:uncharacterized protein LOC135385455 n=1 Tax=Ornithodoros turicata TaxID=34597 RepID=UPI0031399F0A